MPQGFFDNLNGKQGAVFGFLAGIAIVSVVGFVLAQGNGTGFGGSLVSNSGNNAPTPSAAAPTPTPTPNAPSPSAAQIREVDDTDHVRGNPNAKITLVEYSDFECPFCQRHVPTINQILEAYPNDVNLVYRHFPLRSIHPQAQKSAEASECAGEQGKFWEMHDALFAAAADRNLSITTYKQLAGQLNLNQSQFDSCLDTSKFASLVQDQLNDGQAAGVTGTPGTFVNGQLVRGAVPYSTFQSIIESLL